MFKKVLIIGLATLTVAATSLTAFALTNASTPADILSNLTGKSVEEVTQERIESNKTYGTIANDAGLLEEYQEEMLKSKKAFLDEKVADGTITQSEADEIYNSIQERQESCTGNGNGYGMMGYGFGNGGRGQGQGTGLGQGRGCGRGWQ